LKSALNDTLAHGYDEVCPFPDADVNVSALDYRAEHGVAQWRVCVGPRRPRPSVAAYPTLTLRALVPCVRQRHLDRRAGPDRNIRR
jgi:hypothetical protein